MACVDDMWKWSSLLGWWSVGDGFQGGESTLVRRNATVTLQEAAGSLERGALWGSIGSAAQDGGSAVAKNWS